MNTETIIQVPMQLISRNIDTGEQTFRVPVAHNGIEITRALGRCCSGDRLTTKQVITPVAQCVTRYSDGKPFLVCINF